MTTDADDVLREHGASLADAITAAVPGWVVRCVVRAGGAALRADAERAGTAAAADVGPSLHALLTADVDAQRGNPLAIVRDAVRFPTEVLRAAGVARPTRSPFDQQHFPGDDYGLAPMTWADIDESLREPGIVWGAIKARAHLERHRDTT
ncbi:MAG: hypothetical protein QOI47_957 [Actinomycetota bacterium]|nr:hypothetical protein [Actinomycetota bacterium]